MLISGLAFKNMLFFHIPCNSCANVKVQGRKVGFIERESIQLSIMVVKCKHELRDESLLPDTAVQIAFGGISRH